MGMSESKQHNRRQYYRIQDLIGLEYQPLTGIGDSQDLFEDRATQSLHRELGRIDQEIRQHLAALADRDRGQASLLKAFNHKLDTLARIMAFEQKPLQPEQWRTVTLSEGGVCFSCSGAAPQPGDTLALRLTLLPELQRILVRAKVVDKEFHKKLHEVLQERIPDQEHALEVSQKTEQQQVHLEFSDLTDSARQTIARHVLRAQARQRQGQ